MALASLFAVKRERVAPPETQAPSTPPDREEERAAKRRQTADQLAVRPALLKDAFAEGVIVHCDIAQKCGDKHDTLDVLSEIHGRYFLVGKNGGSPVYRQDRLVYIMGIRSCTRRSRRPPLSNKKTTTPEVWCMSNTLHAPFI